LDLDESGAERLTARGAGLDPEQIPSGRVLLLRDILKAFRGEDFCYYEPEGGFPKKAIGIAKTDYVEYFTLFRRYKVFGLPHGKGFLHELEWVIDFLEYMEYIYHKIEIWQINRPAKKSQKLTPEMFGG